MAFTEAQLRMLEHSANQAASFSKKEALNELKRWGLVTKNGRVAEPYKGVIILGPSKHKKKKRP